jgi:NAD(P) transhydrogenase subunit alpha
LIVGVPKESIEGEDRVSVVPSTVAKLIKAGLEVLVERGAGVAASYPDDRYEAAGAKLGDGPTVLSTSDVILKVREPALWNDGRHEADQIKEGATLISFLFPLDCPDTIRRLRDRRVTSLAMERMPRITRAQSMDALSSMSSIAGYKAVLMAADLLPKFFPMMMTAAGTITPARVLILGAGVAGLQAIASARRLGAVVEAFDIRPVVKEQVESLGARFVDLNVDNEDAEDKGGYAKEQSDETQARIREVLKRRVAKSDAVITTALIPGKKAPVLVTADMVDEMSPGSVVVDLAAEQGGNCELSVAGQTIVHKGVKIAGPRNLPARMPLHASDMYSRNISTYLLHLVEDGELKMAEDDELATAPVVTRNGEILDEAVRAALGEAPAEENGGGDDD